MRKARHRDVMTQEQRSRCMASIKGYDTGPELRLRRALWKRGWRYRLKTKLPGKPDMVFVSQRVAIFVDGCFWHGCPKHGVSPKTNQKFWEEKLRANLMRDREVGASLREAGWTVIRFWEHDVNDRLGLIVAMAEKKLRKVLKRKRPPNNLDRRKGGSY